MTRELLAEADRLVALTGGKVWYTSPPGRFLIYREGTGLIGRRTSPADLVTVLRGQVLSYTLILTPRDKRATLPK